MRALILGSLLALPAPAMAEQPSDQLTSECVKQGLYEWDKSFQNLLEHQLHDDEAFKAWGRQLDQLVERCMLQRGFRLRTNNHYCSATEGSTSDPNCYERLGRRRATHHGPSAPRRRPFYL